MKLSVVIPALNEEGHIGALLSDLGCQTRPADEMIVVDGRSTDETVPVVENFPGVKLLACPPSVSRQRNLGGRSAGGDVLLFLDSDVRLRETFLEEFFKSFEDRRLDVACPLYLPPPGSGVAVKGIHIFFNAIFVTAQKVLPSGSGQGIAIKREVFRQSGGFDTTLKFADDIEFIRRASKDRRFGIVGSKVVVSDRRFRKYGVARTFAKLLCMSLLFVPGWFGLSNRIEYEFGRHEG